jgi:hypothetical protein
MNHTPNLPGIVWFEQYRIHWGINGKRQLLQGVSEEERPATSPRKDEYRSELRKLPRTKIEDEHENIDLSAANHLERLMPVGGGIDFAAFGFERLDGLLLKRWNAAPDQHSRFRRFRC